MNADRSINIRTTPPPLYVCENTPPGSAVGKYSHVFTGSHKIGLVIYIL